MIDHGKRNVLGVNINAVDYEAAVQQVADAAKEKRPLGVTALAVHGVMTGAITTSPGRVGHRGRGKRWLIS
jgi:hypothetical protein